MQNIKLVACDMDGTLLNNAKQMPKDFIPWVQAHPEVRVVIASGRQYETLRRDMEAVQDSLYFLADNGALVFYQDKLLHSDEMKKEVTRDLLRRIDAMEGVYPILSGAKSAYMRHASPLVEENGDMYYKKMVFEKDLYSCIDSDVIVKIACFFENADAAKRKHEFDGIDESVEAVVSGSEWIDVLNVGVNKGTGVQTIQKKYGILPEESMAFGDFMNDYELLMSCGESYAMENAHPDLKAAAKYIAPSNEEEGVMQILRERFGE